MHYDIVDFTRNVQRSSTVKLL